MNIILIWYFRFCTQPYLSFEIFIVSHLLPSVGTSRLAPDGCELLCCGPGFRAGRAEVVQRCSCKFSWCCSVRCQQCKNTVLIHTCREWSAAGTTEHLLQKPHVKITNQLKSSCWWKGTESPSKTDFSTFLKNVWVAVNVKIHSTRVYVPYIDGFSSNKLCVAQT